VNIRQAAAVSSRVASISKLYSVVID